MPAAMINGHMPPFLLRNAGPGEIRERVISDFVKAGAGGLTVTTAGSLAAGSGVGRMRWLMLCTQNYCRYDSPRKVLRPLSPSPHTQIIEKNNLH